jgi:hypothetical protein
MPLLVRATVVLVLVAGCGGSDRQQAAKPSAPHPVTHPVTRTVTATTTVAPATTTAESEPATTATQQAPAVPAPAGGGAWRDCGRIRSPVDRRPQDVEAKVFDCRAARRVAVRYLRNGALPQGWTPADCAASRAACEQGGWGFRVVQK